MISVGSLSKDYGSVRAVSDLSFGVSKGEVVGFLGPNGAGKTTTMQILTGYIDPTSGRVLVDGLDVTEHPLEVKKRMGYLPENTPLYEDLTVYDFLEFAASVRGLKQRKRDAIREASERCGIVEVINRTIGTLSKGYRQRVGLAQAILHDPDILILDEPTTGLDPLQVGEIRNLIRELGREKTILLSTHILSEVELTCSRVIVIHRGSIAADSPIEKLRSGMAGGIRIEYRGGVRPAVFERFGRVEEVVEGGGGVFAFRLIPRDERDIREDVYRFCKTEDLVLLELHSEKRSLEDVFRELTER
ncbi:MAG: ATP-binding cassette domain-containing protein [Nitrospirae bacterium]|nr:ATP-binding cassette domain-containing protein [Nitrospirota bacterium]